MYLKKLEISGFKSFATKTVLDFEGGITAVVGPNGCGKSNIFDAIRWVLGEQSAKTLRGAQMEDVIFNGTETEAGVGFAEVSLMFDNSNKNLPIDYEEVIITRRLYRSGESEYLMNKSPVRLKDISMLFMGTGIGAESYSLVGQGKIDMIVSIKPEERRFFIDEAAGITKFKSKKRETLRKLQDTENNLVRLNDIITEVRRQIASIERQANKARRYNEKFKKLKDLETQLAFYDLDDIDRGIKEKGSEADSLAQEEQRIKDELFNKISEIERNNSELEMLKNEVQKIKNDLVEVNNTQKNNAHNIQRNTEHIEDYKKLIASSESKKDELTARIKLEEENISVLEGESSLLETKIKQASIDLTDKENALAGNNSAIKSLQKGIVLSRTEILDKTANLTKLKNELTDLSGQLISWQARKRRLDIEKAKINQEKEVVQEQFERVQEEFSVAEAGISDMISGIENLKNDIVAKKSESDIIDAEITDLESKLITLDSQRHFLEDLKLRYDNLPEIKTATVFVDSETLTKGLVCGVLGKVIECKEMTFDEKNALGDGHTSKFIIELKPIDLDAKDISKRIGELTQKITDIKSQKESLDGQIHSEEEKFSDKEKELHQSEINFSNISLKKTDFEVQLLKFDEELSLVEAELKEADDLLFNFTKNIDSLKSNNSVLEEQISSLEGEIDKNQQETARYASLREKEIIDIARLKAELSALDEARSNQVQTRKMLEETKNSHFIDKEVVITQEKELREKLEETQKYNLQLESENVELNNRLSTFGKNLEFQQTELDKKVTLICNLEQGRQELDKNSQEINTRVFNLRLTVQETEFKKKSIIDRMQQLYQMQESEIQNMDKSFIENNIVVPSIEELKSEVGELRKKIQSYGNVNLVAVEEHEELNNRLEFLTTQNNDLSEAKESLLKAIRKINHTSRKLFVEMFEAVNEEFKKYFHILFNGGQGHLFLVDEQDPLESGIEIVCRPPGKKLQNVSLLSGGEKSMAAIALMFAIFKIKPAPFCVLDEVDGALDEANIDRFRKVLEGFSEISQFIVITHNKKTISSSNTMYGITMEKSGISKIVSVRFARDHKEREAEMVAG